MNKSVIGRSDLSRILTCSSRRKLLVSSAVAMNEEVPRVSRKKSVLLDGNNTLYHYYDPKVSVEQHSDQVNTSAVDGMMQLLRRMDKTHAPEHISVVFDSKERLITRRILEPSYKTDRAPTPRALLPQFDYAKKVLETVQVNCIECPGLEADDLIASYSTQYTAAGFDVLLISNDNDFLQLVESGDIAGMPATAATPTVELYQPAKRRYIRERSVRSRFGLQPKLLPDFHALCGHQWKKLPRVDNLNDEMAVQLLTEYGGLYPLLRQLDALDDPILCKTLKQCITSIESSYRMVKLVDSVTLPIAIEELLQPQLNKCLLYFQPKK